MTVAVVHLIAFLFMWIDMYKSDASEGALLPAAPLRLSLSIRICPPRPRIREYDRRVPAKHTHGVTNPTDDLSVSPLCLGRS